MKKLNEVIRIGFKVNWTFIEIGYLGQENIPPQINESDICDYCYLLLEDDKLDYQPIIELISEKNDKYTFREILHNLSEKEGVDYELQVRKWRVYIVKNTLRNLPEDTFEGLLELMELWITLGIPKDCPFEIQGRDNKLSPEEYYTNEQFKIAKEQNIAWINKEIDTIKILDGIRKL